MLAILFFKQLPLFAKVTFKFIFTCIWGSCKDQDINQKWQRRKGWVRSWLSNVSSATVLAMGLKPFSFCGTSILSNTNLRFLRHWSLVSLSWPCNLITEALPKMQLYNHIEVHHFILKYLSTLYVKNYAFKIFLVSKNFLLISHYFTAL